MTSLTADSTEIIQSKPLDSMESTKSEPQESTDEIRSRGLNSGEKMTSLPVDSAVTIKVENADKKAPKPARLVGIRHLQAVMMSSAVMLSYALRVTMSVTIVAMVDKENANPDFPQYEWDLKIQSYILSSFFWGYVLLQIPAGITLNLFGGKTILLVCVLGTSVFSLLTPLAASVGGWKLVVALRILQGFCQGGMFPSTNALVAKWAPVDERSFLAPLVASGAQLGTVIALPLCGVLSTSAWGWPSAFYLFGVIGVAWSVLWIILGANSPAQARFISTEERSYIEDSIGDTSDPETKRTIPIKAIMTSIPFWAILIANCGHVWGFWTLLTEMPTFMSSVLGFDLNENALLSAMPYLAMFLLSFVFSWISTVVNNRKLVTLGTSRKIFHTIGVWGPGFCMIGLAYSTDNTVTVALLTLAVGLNAAVFLGFNLNHIDIAPNHAGTLMGLTNGAGNIMAILGPLVVGIVVTESGSVSQWRIVFFIAAAFYFVSSLVFIAFASGEMQYWNDYGSSKPAASKLSILSHRSSFRQVF